ncbi:pentachlorophenol monooxygenase [Mycobacterium sp. 852002-51152_SCH6134967]|uniref:FAD-dependent monooxygenase n=1 Tax=Mycobacterium sp. 852002-51152_SCH6134967 TaxID=1834096 RepID=UPI0007FD003F|nr:FAD-dependent monooxygenase [Mycobacterium sp. 852002-51152_SCH6134967]OBF93166.1 pentachlorophenol monooxygenase [Mycobacterium sp. 852002-51152_SCH6134967]
MRNPEETQVLIAGAGPVGLTAAIELARRGVDCRIVDSLPEPPRHAKAVGVQPRSLEVFENMGILGRILDAATPMRGQLVYVNGEQVAKADFDVPADVPFGFVAIPQYATEAILRDELAARGVRVERGWRLTGFDQDADGVSATLIGDGERTVLAGYLVGADGAHSTVRKALGLTFEGGAFAEQYMLGDVDVDWSLPRGYAVRSMHQTDGTTDDLLVCIPLPDAARADSKHHRRYRMSMLVPDELASAPADGVAHGFEGVRAPELHHIQAVLDRLSPEPTTARNLRWSSVFRISHRIVDAYGCGRVFVAGDAAHIHPPTGAQGMNTGIQDAHNLAWKLALAVSGAATPDLLDSYDAERRPVGEEVVGRTVRSARDGIGADSTDPQYVIRREAQLLIDYADSPIVASGAGRRADDANGLTRDTVTGPLRLFQLFGRDHTTLLYAGAGCGPADVADFERAAAAAIAVAGERVTVHMVAAPDADVADTALPLIRDADGQFARAYHCAERAMFVVRPDGYLGYAAAHVDAEDLAAHLRSTFAR